MNTITKLAAAFAGLDLAMRKQAFNDNDWGVLKRQMGLQPAPPPPGVGRFGNYPVRDGAAEAAARAKFRGTPAPAAAAPAAAAPAAAAGSAIVPAAEVGGASAGGGALKGMGSRLMAAFGRMPRWGKVLAAGGTMAGVGGIGHMRGRSQGFGLGQEDAFQRYQRNSSGLGGTLKSLGNSLGLVSDGNMFR